MTITKIIKRHHWGCFTEEDDKGKHFMVQLAIYLEEFWQANQ
jgi:hypothetical protein